MATTNWGAAPSLNETATQSNGLLGTATPPTGAPFTQAGATSSGVVSNTEAAQTQANLQSVAPEQTASGGLAKMLAEDSPYLQRAKSSAAQIANSRGLLNSSMAATAGTAAAIDAAAPIAQADANLFADSRNRNQEALNNTGQFNAGEANKYGLQKQAQSFTAEQSGLDRTQQTDITQMQQDFSAAQSALDRAQQAYLTDRSAANQMALQNAQNTFAGSQSALDRAQQAYLQNDSQAFQQSLTQMQQAFTASQSNLDRAQQAYLQNDAQAFQQSLQNAQIPANFAIQISTSTMQSINAIAADPNLSGKADGTAPAGSSPKSRAIQSALSYSNSQIAWANTFYKTNIPQLPSS